MFSLTIEKYGRRNFAVYLNGRLLAVTVYKKGAQAVAATIGELLTALPQPVPVLRAV